ncbi:MAG TPA: hypothetical protein EYN66_17830 [Myxococcales bacterium]|nr:hypothetical protein [Myxococcales bacterium]
MSTAAFAGESSLGFPLGEKSRLHTNLTLGVGYDTNPVRADSGSEFGGTKARISPSIAVSIPGSAFNLGLNGGMNIDQFITGGKPCNASEGNGSANSSATCLGGYVNLAVRGGSSNSLLAFELDGGLTASPTDVFAPPRPSVNAAQSNQTSILSDLGADELRHSVFRILASPKLVLRPGGGALEFRLGYSADLLAFDALGDSSRHRGTFEGKLRFLPRTAAVMNADFASWTGTDSEGGTISATPYNVSLGLRGQITSRLQTAVSLGYGDALNEEGQGQQQGVIARTMLRYLFARNMNISVGYNRGIDNVLRLASFLSNTGFLNASFVVAERLKIELASSFELRTFANGSSAQVAIAGLRAGYQFFDFLNANLTYQLLSQAVDQSSNMATSQLIDLTGYQRHVVMFGIGLRY